MLDKEDKLPAVEGVDLSLVALQDKYDHLTTLGNGARDLLPFESMEDDVNDCLVAYLERAVRLIDSGKIRLESCADAGILVRGIYQICNLAINGDANLLSRDGDIFHRCTFPAFSMGETGEWADPDLIEALGIQLTHKEIQQKIKAE